MDDTRPITEDDLIRALERAIRDRQTGEDGDGVTFKELKKALKGVPRYRIYAALDELGDRVVAVKVRRTNRANRISVVPAYRLAAPGKHEEEHDA